MRKCIAGILSIISALSLTACTYQTFNEDEILNAKQEESKLNNMMDILNETYKNVYGFIKYDIEDKEYTVTDLDLENLNYEVTKALDMYNSIDFNLLNNYCDYLDSKNEIDEIDYDKKTLELMQDNFKNIITMHEEIIKLGEDKTYSNSDYDKIDSYDYEISKSVNKINMYMRDFDDFFKFYSSFAYDLDNSTLTDIENELKQSGYKYEYEKNDNTESKTAHLLKSLYVYDNNSENSITFQGFAEESDKYNLILVQYNIEGKGSVSISSKSFIGINDKFEYGAFNQKTAEKIQFETIDEQYDYIQTEFK